MSTPLDKRGYVMSEPHLSGYRLVIGFGTLADVQAAHEYIAKLSKSCEACNGMKQVMMRVQYVHRACTNELRPCPLCSPDQSSGANSES